jgi:hypothetical protein
MITDLFEGTVCRNCGATSGFERMDALPHKSGTDFLYTCKDCGALFIGQFAREGGYYA